MTEPLQKKHLLLILPCMLAITVRAEQMPNPVATYCDEQGGTYRVIREAEGERGICVLQDGREVDAWDYLREQQVVSPVVGRPAAEAKRADGGPMTGHELVGGWTRQDTVSEEARAALDWVLGQMNTAARLRGIRELWTQVVAGLNYAIEFELDNDEVWHTIVFRDLDGRFHMTKAAQLGPLPGHYELKD